MNYMMTLQDLFFGKYRIKCGGEDTPLAADTGVRTVHGLFYVVFTLRWVPVFYNFMYLHTTCMGIFGQENLIK